MAMKRIHSTAESTQHDSKKPRTADVVSPSSSHDLLPVFRYGPALRSDQIRLLKLKPGPPGSHISFDLSTQPRGHGVYYALSYTWGIPICDRPAECNGHRLMITQSLETALLRLREKYAGHDLWVDAVCINQADTVDKSVQVRKMATIYHGAETVIVWLGEESTNTSVGLRLLEKICELYPSANGKSIRELYLDETSRPGVMDSGLGMDGLGIPSDITSQPWEAACRIFDAPWFERRWILQEVTNSKHCIFQIGNHESTPEIVLGSAYRITRLLNFNPALTKQQKRHCDRAVAIVQLLRAEQEPWLHESLVDLLTESTSFKSSDARDRVFAVVGCLKGFTEPDFWAVPRKQLVAGQWEVSQSSLGSTEMLRKVDALVDYTKSLLEVLTDVALCEEGYDEFMLSMLRNLCYVDVLEENVPSWIPTWRFSSPDWASLYLETVDPLNDGMYDVEQMELSVSQDKSTLQTQAIVFDKIMSVSEPVQQMDLSSDLDSLAKSESAKMEALHEASSWLFECEKMAHSVLQDSPKREDCIKAFVECYRFGATSDEDNPVTAYETYLRYSSILSAIQSHGAASRRNAHKIAESYQRRCREWDIDPAQPGLEGDDKTIAFEYPATLAHMAQAWDDAEQSQRFGRRFFVSGGRKMGWVPLGAAPGDELCVAFGFATPFAIRKADCNSAGGEDRYRLLGASYVHEHMDGEVFLDDELERKMIRIV